MGLDSVELVIRTEEEFGIQIADAEAEGVTTPRELAALVSTRIPLQPNGECLTRQAFYRLRKTLCAQGVSRQTVVPTLRFAEIYDTATRRSAWSRLKQAMGEGPWPALTREWLRPFELNYPRGCETVWGMSRHLATWDARVPRGPNAVWWREGVLLRVRQITSEQLGIHTFNDDDRYVQDLGVD